MNPKYAVPALAALLVAGCGSGTPTADYGNGSAAFATPTVPTTVEGTLEADVAEGEVAEDGYSDYNFGVLRVGQEQILVVVSGDLLRSAGLPDGIGDVVATIGSGPGQHGQYTITALRRK